jgi:uncharacterized membrane protein YeaQ/YmgE (transglycosylase-associated protein family)
MTFWQNLGTIGGTIITVATIIGFLARWIMKQNEKHDKKLLEPVMEGFSEIRADIQKLHDNGKCRAKENGMIFRMLLGIVDCLETNQINGNLSKPKEEITEYLTKLED